MSNIKLLEQTLLEANSLKLVTQGYSEIAATKLQNIRGSMEKNIAFARELGDIFHIVKKEVIKRKLPQKPKINGVINLLISSNNRFYGNIEKPLAKYFAVATQKVSGTQIVVGKTGPTFLKASNYKLPYQQMVFKKDLPNPEEFKLLTETIYPYQTVLIYHSRFKTVLTQLPVVSDITKSLIKPSEIEPNIHYIFEPELAEIYTFFETQIMQILLNQTFLESELARTASRLIAMDQAESNANDYLKQIQRNLSLQKRFVSSSKSLEMVNALINIKSMIWLIPLTVN